MINRKDTAFNAMIIASIALLFYLFVLIITAHAGTTSISYNATPIASGSYLSSSGYNASAYPSSAVMSSAGYNASINIIAETYITPIIINAIATPADAEGFALGGLPSLRPMPGDTGSFSVQLSMQSNYTLVTLTIINNGTQQTQYFLNACIRPQQQQGYCTAIYERPILGPNQLQSFFMKANPGDMINITVNYGMQQYNYMITLTQSVSNNNTPNGIPIPAQQYLGTLGSAITAQLSNKPLTPEQGTALFYTSLIAITLAATWKRTTIRRVLRRRTTKRPKEPSGISFSSQ